MEMYNVETLCLE